MQIFHCPHCHQPIDQTMLRFAQGKQRHLYPSLVAMGMGHLWQGPGPNSFHPQLIEGARLHLKKWKLPCERGDALNTIRNKIRQEDFGWLELAYEAGNPKPEAKPAAQPPRPQAADPGQAPPFGTAAYWQWVEARRGPES